MTGGPATDVEVRRVELACDGRSFAAVVWLPATDVARPLVLLGHGGSGDKLTMAPLAARCVTELGYVAAAIDGPVHGERRRGRPEEVLDDFRSLWREGRPMIDEMVDDWRAAIDQLQRLPEVDTARIGWCGVSMGTGYGLPVVAADSRIKAAVLGMWGFSYPSSARLRLDAPKVRCPVLFQRKADDELFTVEGQEELFASLGSTQKELNVYPGGHSPAGSQQTADMLAFLAAHLKAQ